MAMNPPPPDRCHPSPCFFLVRARSVARKQALLAGARQQRNGQSRLRDPAAVGTATVARTLGHFLALDVGHLSHHPTLAATGRLLRCNDFGRPGVPTVVRTPLRWLFRKSRRLSRGIVDGFSECLLRRVS